MFNLTDIKEQLRLKPICFVYRIKSPSDFELVFKTFGKNDSKKKIKEKYGNKKNNGDYFIISKITFHTGTKFSQGGPIALNLDVYVFDENKLVNVMKVPHDRFKNLEKIKGVVWFDKVFLEKKGWDYKYIDNIIKKLIKGNFQLVQRTIYHVKFI